MREKSSSRACFCLLLMALLFPVSLSAEPVSLRHAVELALQHASGIAVSAADQKRALGNYHELRNSYIPQINAGAGIGYSDGFPLSLEGAAPSLFNVTAQSALFNLPLQDFLRAAHADMKEKALATKDQRNAVIQDTVLSYAELAKWEKRIDNLRETQAAEQKMAAGVAERVKEGIDSEMDAKRAQLSVARVHLRMAEAQGAADVLREHLSKLTGVPANSFETDADTIPALPQAKEDEISAASSAEQSMPVQEAVEHARAQYLRLEGARKSLWPTMDFAGQYANLASFNNYERYYQTGFPPNNVTVGISVRLPFLNYAQRARIEQAKADALLAKEQVDVVRNQASEQTLRLQRSVTQMQAAREVAELEYEIAQKNVAAVKTKMESSAANLHDLDNAQAQASERFMTLQDVIFGLEKSEVELLRATGDLESWAMAR
jgi:outer membrane protein TolC